MHVLRRGRVDRVSIIDLRLHFAFILDMMKFQGGLSGLELVLKLANKKHLVKLGHKIGVGGLLLRD